jgi:hypothetical protein
MRRFYLPAILLLISFTGSVYASSKIPVSYIPRHVRNAIESYVPGAEITKAQIGSDDRWGTTYDCEYIRGRHKGSITVSEHGRLTDLSQELDPAELPSRIARLAEREARGGTIRKTSLDEDRGRFVYKVEANYGRSSAKIKLKITRSGDVVERNFD